MALIDVIIPVYNGEKYIDNIFNTFKKQTLQDFRLIFVDDGSTDNSYNCLIEKSKSSSLETLIIHQENSKVPTARNTGIKAATADYICFMDTDDTLNQHYLEYLYQSINLSDSKVALCQYESYSDTFDEKDPGKLDYEVLSSEEMMKHHYLKKWSAVWLLMIDRKWLLENNLLFVADCYYLEDNVFLTELFNLAEKVSLVSNILHHYYVHQGSLLRSSDVIFKHGLKSLEILNNSFAGKDSKAIKVYREIGIPKTQLALLRRAALQLNRKMFLQFASEISFKDSNFKISELPKSNQLSIIVYNISKSLFYGLIRKLGNKD